MQTNKTHPGVPVWNTGHFPVGTVVKASFPWEQEVFQYTVTGIVKTTPDDYVLKTNQPSELEKSESFNMCFVTEIVKRGNGHVIIDTQNDRSLKFFEEDQKRNAGSFGIRKHKSQYLVFLGIQGLIHFIVDKYTKPDMCIDTNALIDKLLSQGVLQIRKVPGDHYGFRMNYFVSNKKRLNKSVKRLINKCLIKVKLAVELETSLWGDCDNQFHFIADSLYDTVD